MNFSTSASIFGSNLSHRFGDREHVAPGSERMQRDAEIAEDFLALRVDVVEEDHEAVVAFAVGVAQRLDEVDLALPSVARSSTSSTRWPGINWPSICAPRPKPFGFLAHILHRQIEPVGDPGGERNAGGLAARHRVDLAAADVAGDGVDGEIHQRRAHVGKRDQPARVVIDRARPAGREDERLVGHEAHRAGVEIHARGQLGDGLFVEEMGVHG